MSVWTWVLIGLGVAGALLGTFSLAAVIREALRLRARVKALRNSRLFLAAQSMQIQTARLSHISAQAQPLVQRAQAAAAVIRASSEEARMPQAKAALRESGAEISALLEDLR
jgi:hypothetical protein